MIHTHHHSHNSTADHPSFPYVRTDDETWSALKGQSLRDGHLKLETHCQASLADSGIELMQVIQLDLYQRFKQSDVISSGTEDHMIVSHRFLVERILHEGTCGLVIAHNHITDPVEPSHHDIAYTQSLNHVLDRLEITLWDHLIIRPNAVFSMRRAGLLF